MKTIIIKTQLEIDSLPDSFSEYTQIRIEATERIHVKMARGNSRVEARGNSRVEAWGNSRVEARENSSVEAWENSSVEAWKNSRVVAWENSRVEARENSSVVARENSIVVARENSIVVARENSSVVAWENSRVEAWKNSRVEARENSSVVARENSSVEARENSRVVARRNSSVVARENSRVEAWGNSRVEAWGNSRVEARENSSVEARENSSVVARENSSVEAWGNSRVDLFISAYVIVLSSKVIIKKLLDYSTAVFKGVKENVEEKSDTALVREIPGNINPDFNEWLRRGYVFADGITKKLKSQKKIGEIEVYEVFEFPKKGTSFVVKRGETFSHGESIEKAINDLRYKISDRDTSKFDGWKKDKDQVITIEDAISAYRAITGACELGTKQFVESLSNVPEKITPNIILEVTKDSFGNKAFRNFLEGN